MKTFIKYLYILLIIFILKKQSVNGQGENFFSYSIPEGLPQSQVFAICQDSAGYIWAGTQGGGITILDGQKFKLLSSENGAISSGYINALYTGSDHTVWIGSMRGLFLYSNEKLYEVKTEHKKEIQVNSIIEWNKNIFIGSNQGLFLYNPEKECLIATSLNFKLTSQINDIKVIHDQLWVGTNKGLWIQKNQTRPFTKVTGLPYPNINQIHGDDSGYNWLAIYGYGLIKIDVYTQKIAEMYGKQILSKTKSILNQPDDMLWVATENDGICIMNTCTGNISQISEDEGLSTSKIKILFRDIWGNIWIGTSGAGLIKKTSQLFKHYNMFDYGFGGNRVYAITKDNKNKIWLAINKDNIASFEGNTFRKVNIDSLNPGVKIKTLVTDTTGKLWIGTEGKGVYCLDKSGTKVFNTSNNTITDNWIVHMVSDAKNNIWVATQSSGIQCLTPESDTTFQSLSFNKHNGLPDRYIHSLTSDDNNGRIWFVCRNGKAGYFDEKFKISVFDHTNGLPDRPIKTISVDRQGNCYLGISGAGVFWSAFSNNPEKINFRKINVSGKTYSSNIYSMICDSRGNLWLGTENGVYQFAKDQNSTSFTGIIHFKKDDGFLGIENCHNSISIDENDNLWFGTMNGAVYYNSGFETGTQAPPRLHMTEVLLFNQSVSQSKYRHYFSSKPDISLPMLPNNQNNLSFSYEAVQVNFPDKLKYRYLLEGADTQWSSWSPEKRINYSGISPGTYCLKVQSTFDERQLSNTEQICFSIAKPFWEENWFRFAITIFGLAVIIAIFKIRESSIRKKALTQTRELTLKNELLTLEQKALQLQMNPHFIFNALNSIQSLVVNHEPDAARKQIQNFALLMRGILNNSRTKTVSLQTEIELLTKYLNMEQFCQKNEFTYTIKVSDAINQEDIEIPTMLIQPYVENAIIHGISHLSFPGFVEIIFTLQDQLLCCTITDNGVGRKKANDLSLLYKEGHMSVSMEVTGQRLQALIRDSSEAGQIIVDLYDDDHKPSGTKVILKIPVKTTY